MFKIKLTTFTKTISGDVDTPITVYKKYVGENEGFLLESKEQPAGRYSFISTNPGVTLKAYGNQVHIHKEGVETIFEGKALDYVKEIVDAYEIENPMKLPFVGGAVGSVAYDTIKQYEKIPVTNEDTIGTPDVHLMFVRETVVYDHFTNNMIIVVLEEEKNKAKADARIAEIEKALMQNVTISAQDEFTELQFSSNMTEEYFEKAVEKAKQYIYDGDIFQVVLSQRWEAQCEQDPFSLYRKLRRLNPSPYMYYFKFDDYYIVGSSPEMLVELREDRIRNCPIAGTRKRGKTDEEDRALAADLLADEKELAEHRMLVDLGRNDMGKVSKIGSVEVTKYMEVQNYSHVMHIVSLVEGEKAENKDMFDVLMSFLPAGTLSGAPKIRAMEIIEELEVNKRGVYGGAIGYFGYNGEMDMCIAIRTMVIKDNTVYIQAGAGIVADSIATNEFKETENKAKALMRAINSTN